MRKLLAIAVGLTALALGFSAPVGADPAGGVQPTCADIIGDLGAHSISQDTVFGGIRTLTPTCRGFRYTLVVSYTRGGVQKLAFFTKMGGDPGDVVPNANEDGFNGLIKYEISGIVSDTLDVCAAYFSTKGAHLYDAVPDSAQFTAPPIPTDTEGECGGWMTFGGVPGGSFPYN
jgi:hypothetical protein